MSFDIENYVKEQAKNNVVLFYKGNVDSDVINHVLDTVEDKMVEVNEQSKLRKKVYNVLVESLQNLYHHVDKVPEDFEDQTSEKFGLLVVQKVESGYKIITGNFVHAQNIEKLEEKIKRINRSSHEEIKELYKFILNHQRILPREEEALVWWILPGKRAISLNILLINIMTSTHSFTLIYWLMKENKYDN